MLRRAVLALLLLNVAHGATTTTAPATATPPAPNIPDLTTRASAGDPIASVDLSKAYFDGTAVPKDVRKGYDLSLEGAIQGNIGGERNLGYAYLNGLGVHANRAKAYAWYLKAAGQNDALSELNVALFNQFGVGRIPNELEARQWMEKAAIQGLPEAQVRYGDLLSNGIGGDVDLKKGFTYYLRGVYGFAPGRFIVAKSYANGIYVARDPVRAYAWCLAAAGTNPDPKMADFPAKLESTLTIDQMAQATTLAATLLPLAHSGADQPASFAASIASGSSATLKFQKVLGYIVVTLNVQDKGPLDFIVDTGCPSTILDSKLASHFGFVGTDPFPFGGVGPDLGLLTSVTGITLAAPGLRITGARLSLIDNFDFDRYLGRPIAGFLGTDILKHFVVRIDYLKRTLTLTQPGHATSDPKAALLPLLVNHNVPMVSTTVATGTVTGSPADFMIDTGDRGYFSVGLGYQASNPTLSFQSLAASGEAGFGGVASIGEGLADLTLGPHVLKHAVASIVQQRVGIATDGPLFNGDVGNGIWSRFNVTLDFPAGKIGLAPNTHFHDPFTDAESGAGFWTALGDYHTFLIFAVVPDSPAAFAGLQVGDQLTAIDGKPTAALTMEQIYDLLRPLGPHAYKIRRDGADLTLQVPTYDPIAHPDQVARYQTRPDLSPPGTKIASLAVQWLGPALYPDAVILRASGLNVGDVYLNGPANRTLKKLYETGIFSRVSLHAGNTPAGLTVTIQVKARPLVTAIVFTGLTPAEETAIRPKLTAEEGRRESSSDLFQDAEIIRRTVTLGNSVVRAVAVHVFYDDSTMLQRDVTILKATP